MTDNNQQPEFELPPPAIANIPAADVLPAPDPTEIAYQAFPVRSPEDDINDFIVKVKASTLRRCRARLTDIKPKKFPYGEVSLGVATMAWGAVLGALPAGIKPDTWQAIFFFNLLPVLATAATVGYLFLRHFSAVDYTQRAQEVLDQLPDPDKTR